MTPSAFDTHFSRLRRQILRRFALRGALSGVAIGACVSVLAAALGWWTRQGELRLWAGALACTGALIGVLYARKRRWTDHEIALYLDARLGADEAISTALELGGAGASRPVSDAVFARAASALSAATPSVARVRVLSKLHGLLPLCAAAVVALCLLPLPPPPASAAPAPGAEHVRKGSLAGLERLIALEQLRTRDPLEQERLKQIAEEAKRLRADLAKGIERREAQARLAKLRDDIAGERSRLADGQNRAGLEAAIGALEKNPELRAAAKALGNADLVEFDREMQKLANQVEERHREQAKQALEEARKAAQGKSARQLAEALREQQELFERREQRAQALRELAEQLEGKLSPQALEDLKEFGESGSPEAGRRLTDALDKALKGLSEAERKRLAENLQKQLEAAPGDVNPLTRQQIEELAKRLASPENQQELERALKELANRDPSREAERQQRLEDAERGAAEAQRGLGAVPIPNPQPGAGQSGTPPKSPNSASKPGQPGGPGSKRDPGRGDHSGESAPVDGKELRAKADAPVNPALPLQAGTLGRSPARAGETARQQGVGALGSAGPAELGGVEGSDVPEEYREQVGRYFEP